MRHRLALIVGSLATVGTLTVALVAAGLGPADPTLVSSANQPVATPRVQVDTIYLPPPASPPTITVHQTLTTGGESENEPGGDN